jgi:hypothetical protein
VRFQLRPKEAPTGGEGPKVRKITAGVAAGPRGQVVINASAFPEADAGPDSVEPFDFRIVPEDGVEVQADVVASIGTATSPSSRPRTPRRCSSRR